MKKEIKILLGFLVVAVILLFSFYFATKNINKDYLARSSQKTEEVDMFDNIMTYEEKDALNLSPDIIYEVTARDVKGNVATYRELPIVKSITTNLDFMSQEEINIRSFNPDNRYQVLERDDQGTILSYKKINSDDDILNTYNQYTYTE